MSVGMTGSACGLPRDGAATVVTQSALPLPPPTAARTPTEAPFVTGDADARPYFVLDARCTLPGNPIVTRRGSILADAEALLEALAAGPSAHQRRLGWSTRVSEKVTVTVDSLEGDLLRVRIPPLPEELSRARSDLWVSQIVRSLTSLPGVQGVLFISDNATEAKVPLPGGSLVQGRLSTAMVQMPCES